MTWNHRIMRHTDSPDGEPYYALHEVFYDEEGGKPGWTKDPVNILGESPDEIRETLERMLRALDKPVMDYESGEEIAPEQPQ